MIDLSEVSSSECPSRILIGVPFFLLVALVLPLLAMLAPVVMLACLLVGTNPWATFAALWDVLAALRGTHVEVVGRKRSVLVHIW